ncbi:MAG TPA: ATP-binding cassette domain-containing protein [Candidatus Omnitrophota bacterium]|nr:ATP-binding cassette domain-containing protein [Candidatus Omnitrophota bacterium]
MIKIEKLCKAFDHLVVMDKVDLLIPDGETLAVIGPSGCGKSTLLRLILRLETIDSGRIVIDGKDVGALNEEELVILRQKIGMVFQSSALFDSLSVFENVAFPLREHTDHGEAEIKNIVENKLAMVDLYGKGDVMPSELSGGMQKRVSIARALAFDPRIILYDEPTTGLDPITSSTIENLINKLATDLKVISIVVTHQLSTIFRTAHRVVMLDKGKLIEGGSVEQTKRSQNPVISRFINAGITV